MWLKRSRLYTLSLLRVCVIDEYTVVLQYSTSAFVKLVALRFERLKQFSTQKHTFFPISLLLVSLRFIVSSVVRCLWAFSVSKTCINWYQPGFRFEVNSV